MLAGRARHARRARSRPSRALRAALARGRLRRGRGARRGGIRRRDRLLPRAPPRGRATPARSADLRDRCAEAMREALALPGLDHATARARDAGRARVRAPSRTRARPARAASRRLHARGGEQLGLLAPGVAAPAPGCSSWWTAWSPRRSWARPSPIPRPSARALELAGVEAGRGASTWATRRRTTWRARAPPGCAPCSWPGTASRAARRRVRSFLDAGPLPTLRADGRGHKQIPPDPPELPEGAAPRWPRLVRARSAFLVAITATLVVVGIVPRSRAGTDEDDATFTIVATLLQSAIFVGTAVLFASFTRKPRPWHFGLRRTQVLAGRGMGRARARLLLRPGRRLLRDRPARRRADGGGGPRQRSGHLRPDRRPAS